MNSILHSWLKVFVQSCISKETKDSSDKLDELTVKIQIMQDQFQEILLESRLARQDWLERQDLSTRLANLEAKSNNRSVSNVPNQPSISLPHDSSRLSHKTPFKMEIPRFDGHDALGWIFKITLFFYFHNTPEEQRISISSFYMDGPRLSWYQWMYSNNQLMQWTQFLHAL